ncbi:MAG: 6-carboxytetrahydropterin synthase [Nitrospinae bacterium]|nr:6-carboxytetrahydropterin synthase [Nitrospinota bacterium]
MKSETRIRIFRGGHNFSSAHFLVDMGKCERLHGHNYTVTVEISAAAGADHTIIDFNTINPVIKKVCDSLDHRTIIAANDTRHTLNISEKEIEAKFKDKRYVFPKEDCVLLPLVATTVERLAEYVCGRLTEELSGKLAQGGWIEVGVAEGSGQMALYRRGLP